MTDSMSLNVRVSGSLKEFVLAEVNDGAYENNSEYVRDLIRRDKDRIESQRMAQLKAELTKAFSADENEFVKISKEEFLSRKSRS